MRYPPDPYEHREWTDEVLEDGQTLTEVRGDGRLDDLTRRLGHQATHTGKLTNLCGEPRAPESAIMKMLLNESCSASLPSGLRTNSVTELIGDEVLGDLVGDLGPDINDLVVLLTDGDQTVVVLALGLTDFGRVHPEDLALGGWNHMSSTQIDIPALVDMPKPSCISASAKRTVFLAPAAR